MEVRNTQVDNAKHLDLVIAMFDLINYRENHSKVAKSLWQ